MANMSYCRFENTFKDLQDCYMNMDDIDNTSEHQYREKLIQLCKEIVSDYGDVAFGDGFDQEEDIEYWDPDTAYESDRDLQLEFPTE
jgi:hypothetical protein